MKNSNSYLGMILLNCTLLMSYGKVVQKSVSEVRSRDFALKVQAFGMKDTQMNMVSVSNGAKSMSSIEGAVLPTFKELYGNDAKVYHISKGDLPLSDITVSNDGKRVLAYLNTTTTRSLRRRVSTNLVVSKETAIFIANSIIELAGIKSDYKYLGSYMQDAVASPIANGKIWTIRFQKVFKGIPYHNNQANVLINAITGEILAVGAHDSLGPPKSDRIRITSSTAIELSQNFLSKSVKESFTYLDISKAIVSPNHFWGREGMQNEVTGSGTVVWIVRYTKENATIELWVDCLNGNIIGGLQELHRH